MTEPGGKSRDAGGCPSARWSTTNDRVEIARSDFVIETDYFQYYVEDGGDLPDVGRVDASHDGIVGLDHGHARVRSAVRMGRVDVTLTLTDQPIVLPLPPGRIATA